MKHNKIQKAMWLSPHSWLGTPINVNRAKGTSSRCNTCLSLTFGIGLEELSNHAPRTVRGKDNFFILIRGASFHLIITVVYLMFTP